MRNRRAQGPVTNHGGHCEDLGCYSSGWGDSGGFEQRKEMIDHMILKHHSMFRNIKTSEWDKDRQRGQ